jgi:uncharacterized protein GlcG (DUF336 family)
MGLLDHLWGRKLPSRQDPSGPRSPRPRALGVEPLEDRTMPSVTADLTGGVLTVNGLSGPYGQIGLQRDGATDEIVLLDSGVEKGRFASAAVDSIEVNAAAAFNVVRVDESVLQPTTLRGGPGTNHLFGGSGQNILIGGGGTNRLAGGNNADALIGGGVFSDSFFGGGSINQITAGPGIDYIFGARDRDTVSGVDLGRDLDFRAEFTQVDLQDEFLGLTPSPPATLTEEEVAGLLRRAAAASASEDAIIAIVDRGGRILGVRVEGGVSPTITGDPALLSFAIDGALAKARTAAFFGNNTAPLTSRTIQFISQSTITQRMVESNPSDPDPFSTVRGPGFVAPVGLGGNFPPGVQNTPQVDLFEIEGINRDGSFHPGPSGISGAADSIFLPERFNINPAFYNPRIPIQERLAPPDSYGVASGQNPLAQPRGIGTLPGGIPIFKPAVDGSLAEVGAIGVFFPGETGYATEENSVLSNTFDPSKPDRSLEAEWIAFAALGGTGITGDDSLELYPVDIPGLELPGQITRLPFGRIDLVGISLPLFGPGGGTQGPANLVRFGQTLGFGDPDTGFNAPLLDPGPDNRLTPDELFATPLVFDTTGIPNILPGTLVPEGWIVKPQDGVGITAAQVQEVIAEAVNYATIVRSPIRLPLGSPSRVIVVVTDLTGEIVGYFRMPDSLTDALDVTPAKARNVGYYADPNQLQPIDQVAGIPAGTALATRTFRFLAEPFYPEGINGSPPGPFSILLDGGVDPVTGLNDGPPLPAIEFFDTALGHDRFFPETNFHAPFSLNQNGVIFFPGGVPIYANGVLIGGLGVSGEGVDQDDVIPGAAVEAAGLQVPPNIPRADDIFVNGVRLPYLKFNRQPLLQPPQI